MEILQENKSRWLVLASVSLGTFLSVINSSIVNVALPTMAYDFATDLNGIQWVVLAYLLAVSAVLPIMGRLADMLGRKLIYCSGIVIIIVGAIVSALSSSFWLLITARVLMALGAAMPMANGMAIITSIFPTTERGRALGIVSTMVAVGLLSGPVVGGFLVSWGGWQWVFLVNIPLGLLAFFTAWHLLPKDIPVSKSEPFDYLGAALFVMGIISLLLVVTRVQDWGLSNYLTLVASGTTIILLSSFWVVETRATYPLVDFGLFKIKHFSFGILTAFLIFVAAAAIAILTPFYLQDILGYSPSKVGLYMLPLPVAMSIVSPFSGYLSDRMSPAILTTGGLLCCAIGLGWLSLLQPGQNNWMLVTCFALVGFGLGLFQSPNNSSIMGSVPNNKLGLANGLNALTRNMGKVIGTAVMVGVFTAANNNFIVQASGGMVGEAIESYAFMAGWRAALQLAVGLTIVGAIISSMRNLSRQNTQLTNNQ